MVCIKEKEPLSVNWKLSCEAWPKSRGRFGNFLQRFQRDKTGENTSSKPIEAVLW